jgi:hypothetical protein
LGTRRGGEATNQAGRANFELGRLNHGGDTGRSEAIT